jgi:hypothetical protein
MQYFCLGMHANMRVVSPLTLQDEGGLATLRAHVRHPPAMPQRDHDVAFIARGVAMRPFAHPRASCLC